MKKLFLSIAVLLLATLQVRAQANIAGTLYASNFAQWTVSQGNNGPYSWSSSSVCTQATSGGVTFRPFTVGTPIRIVDTATPGNTENVTVNAVNINGSGCNIATSAAAHTHYSFYLASATAGLQEAINYSKQSLGTSNPASVVIVTPAWSTAGGTTTMITPGAQGSVAISILDERTSVIVPYTWISTLYVAQPFNASALTSVTLTGDVTASVSGPGAGTGAATLATVLGSPGPCGDTTHSCGLTLNGKGLSTSRTNNLITGPTLGNTLLPLGIATQQVSFGPSFTLPTFSFSGIAVGQPLVSAYVFFSGNVFQWQAMTLQANTATDFLSIGVSGNTPYFGTTRGTNFQFINCVDSMLTCNDSVGFGSSSSLANYGHIGPAGASFTNGWTLGSLKLSNVTGSTQCLQGDSAGNVTGFGSGCGGSSGLSGMTTGQVAIAGSATTITSSVALGTSGAVIPLLNGANNSSGANIFSANGSASTPPVTLTGTWFTGGSSTTTKPQLLIEPTGATSNGWSVSGTGLGVNAASGFSGRMLDVQLNGVSQFNVAPNSVNFAATNITQAGSSWSVSTTGIQSAPLFQGLAVSGPSFTGTLATPASSSAACTTGAIEWDTGFVYVCTATNTWKRTTLSTF